MVRVKGAGALGFVVKRQRDVVTKRNQERERERAGRKIRFQQSWGSHPVVLPVPPNGHTDAQKQKLHRKNIHGKVITQQSKKELKILQTGEFQP